MIAARQLTTRLRQSAWASTATVALVVETLSRVWRCSANGEDLWERSTLLETACRRHIDRAMARLDELREAA